MDPLSIAAAAAGFLATLESISKKLRDVSRKLRDSTTIKATLELGQQLMQLEFVTRSLLDREIPTIVGSSNASAINVVQKIELNFQSCQKDLGELSRLLDQLDNSLKEKARWVFKNHEKAMELCESLNRHYSCLDLALSTILVLPTHQTRDIVGQTYQQTIRMNDNTHMARQVAEEVKDDTTHIRKSVEQIGLDVERLGCDISEMFTLLRKFDQQRTWPFKGHGGFITSDLCFTLERYIRDQSGIDPDELRSRLSTFQFDDDHNSLRSGWTWHGVRDGVDNAADMSSRYRSPHETRHALAARDHQLSLTNPLPVELSLGSSRVTSRSGTSGHETSTQGKRSVSSPSLISIQENTRDGFAVGTIEAAETNPLVQNDDLVEGLLAHEDHGKTHGKVEIGAALHNEFLNAPPPPWPSRAAARSISRMSPVAPQKAPSVGIQGESKGSVPIVDVLTQLRD